jgi:VWFA-related protein
MKIDGSARALALVFTLSAATLPLLAQQPSDPPPPPPDDQSNRPVLHKAAENNATTIPVVVKEVNLLAVVRDKKGQAITNLTKNDFVLEQDGRAQTIKQFTNESDLPITVGLLADTGPGQRKALADERKAGTDFVNRLREDRDKAFVLHFDKEVELLQDVTASHDKLDRGIDSISVGDQTSSGSGKHRDDEDRDRQHFFFGGGLLNDAIFLTADEVLKPVNGRKVVILFSDGVDRDSKVSLTRAIEAAQRADMTIYCVYVPSEKEQEQQNENTSGRRRGGGFPGGGGSPFPGGGYPGGGGGGRGRSQQPPHENRADGKKVLQHIASETGGHYFEISKKLTASDVYGQITDELHHQYSLSYTPDRAEAGHHKLHLATRKSDLSVQTREGFYAGAD